MNEGCFPTSFVLIIFAFIFLGGYFGTGILYAIIPALFLSPLVSILYFKFDRGIIAKGKILQQIGIIATLAFIICIIVAIGSFFLYYEYDYSSSYARYFAFAITLGLAGCASIFITKANISDEEKAEERRKREVVQKQRLKEKENEIVKKYGRCDKWITNPCIINGYLVRVFFQTNTVILKTNEVFSFTDIVRCDIEKREERGMTIETSTKNVIDNKSVIGRAAVGALVAGAPGAIIGGVTEKKKQT